MIDRNGVEYDTEVAAWYYQDLKFCGCGNPTAVCEFIRDSLQLLKDNDYEAKNKHFGDGGMGWLVLYQLEVWGYTEHGGSVFSSWLSEEGLQVLHMLKNSDLEAI